MRSSVCRAGIRGPGGGVGPAENVAAGGANAEASDDQEMELDSDDTDVCFTLLAFLF